MSNLIRLFAFLIGVAYAALLTQADRPLLGGPRQADLNDNQTKIAVQTAKDLIVENYGICQDALSVNNATRQVVNGAKFVIYFQVNPAVCTNQPALNTCEAHISMMGYTVISKNVICSKTT